MFNKFKVILLVVVAAQSSGCFFTKIATVPMRLAGATIEAVGAVASIVPGAGNTVDEAIEKANELIDETADGIDKLPF